MNSNIEVTTNDLIRVMCSELALLTTKKITPARANASARLGMTIVEAANLEVVHHKLKPARGSVVRPVLLAKPIVADVPKLENKSRRK